MIILTLTDALAAHKKLWEGIADDIEEKGFHYKDAQSAKDYAYVRLFPKLKFNDVRFRCFLCEFSAQESDSNMYNCNACPCIVPKESIRHMCLDGLYDEFRKAYAAKNEAEAVWLARGIANLPVKNPKYEETTKGAQSQ